MKRKTKIIWLLIIIVVLFPLWMWLAWLFTSKKNLVLAIVDKTEISRNGQEHVSLTWVLNHQRYTKTPTKPYGVEDDYFGFFPSQDEKYRLKGLERFSEQQLEQLSNDCSAAYFTDTYGVFNNEWFSGKASTERSGILYGGLSREDVRFLEKMKQKKKLIVTEFNCIGSPTAAENREEFEKLFAVKWSGWIGRYFESLDTVINRELPHWLKNNYLAQHNNSWPFRKGGVALVSDKDEVEILEEGRDLNTGLPRLLSSEEAQDTYGLPAEINYSFWFDIMRIDSSVNDAPAHFSLDVTKNGKELLHKHQLSADFPAVIRHQGSDYQFYYFCADFCDNPVDLRTSYFKGIGFFKRMFYSSEPGERGSFFWNYYRPLLTTILNDHYRTIAK